NLGVKYDAQDPLFRGQTFFADTALAKGYVDAYGSLEDAILWVSAQKTVKRANKMI
ncbi:S49 family peptidase, partial [Bacteroides fragilis]